MPSNLHEWLLELFRNRSATVPDLLRNLDISLPEYDSTRIEMPNVNSLRPVEFAADLVVFLARGSRYVFGVVVEVQLSRDEDKPYVWPVYVANLRARQFSMGGKPILSWRGGLWRRRWRRLGTVTMSVRLCISILFFPI